MGIGLSDMLNADQLRSQLREYLAGSLAIDDFEDWFLGNGWNVHLYADADTVALAHRTEGLLLDLSANAISESVFRQELENIVRPLAHGSRFVVVAQPQELSLNLYSSAQPRTIGYSVPRRSGDLRDVSLELSQVAA